MMIKSKFRSAKFDHDDVSKKMMKAFDINKDKEIHLDEFTNGMTKRLFGDDTVLDQYIKVSIVNCIENLFLAKLHFKEYNYVTLLGQ